MLGFGYEYAYVDGHETAVDINKLTETQAKKAIIKALYGEVIDDLLSVATSISNDDLLDALAKVHKIIDNMSI